MRLTTGQTHLLTIDNSRLNMKQTCLKFLESGRDGTGAVGDCVSLARHVLALDVGDVHEKLLARVLKEGGRKGKRK